MSKQPRVKDKKDLNDWMTILTVVVGILFSLGLTALYIWFNHDMTPLDFFGSIFGTNNMKITAQVTGNIFTGLVAFAFIGVLIMFGVRKLVFYFVKKKN